MKLKNQTSHFLIAILSVSMILMGTSCDKEPTEEAPELPPVSSILMDYSDFGQAPAGMKSTAPSSTNFYHAFTSVTFWQWIATVPLAVPVTAYAIALEQEAEYIGNNTWEWSYDVTVNSIDYKVSLTASRQNNEEFTVDMSLNLKDLPGKGVTWFDGLARYDRTHAAWNLYKVEGLEKVKILDIDWTHNYETEAGNMTYNYVEPGHQEEGSSIYMEWLTPESAAYDAKYAISVSTGDIDVEWNRTTKAGRVMDPVYFEDELWHCWDETLVDVDCSAE